jgi:nitrogenase iron protein NifH
VTRSIAIYGKGGSGKSSIATALSSCFAERGMRVLHVGCDPKSDSSRLLVSPGTLRTVLGTVSETESVDASSLLMPGYREITCVEAGGPEPGVGCAGRGITRTFELLQEMRVSFDDFDMVIFDVLGDVVCGGFAMPMRAGHAKQVCVVVSGTGMSLFAANNISRAVERFYRNGVRLAGLVANYHTGPIGRPRVEAFALAIGTRVLAHIPHDPMFQIAEEARRSIYDYAPTSASANVVRALADSLADAGSSPPPKPLDRDAFERFLEAHPLTHSAA